MLRHSATGTRTAADPGQDERDEERGGSGEDPPAGPPHWAACDLADCLPVCGRPLPASLPGRLLAFPVRLPLGGTLLLAPGLLRLALSSALPRLGCVQNVC